MAIQSGNNEAVKYLLGKGADAHIEDSKGKDACDYARMSPLFSKYPVFNNCQREYRKHSSSRQSH